MNPKNISFYRFKCSDGREIIININHIIVIDPNPSAQKGHARFDMIDGESFFVPLSELDVFMVWLESRLTGFTAIVEELSRITYAIQDRRAET